MSNVRLREIAPKSDAYPFFGKEPDDWDGCILEYRLVAVPPALEDGPEKVWVIYNCIFRRDELVYAAPELETGFTDENHPIDYILDLITDLRRLPSVDFSELGNLQPG